VYKKKHTRKTNVLHLLGRIHLINASREKSDCHLRKEQVSDELRARTLLSVLKAAENKIVLGNVQVVEI
jgi:hypothetical protein